MTNPGTRDPVLMRLDKNASSILNSIGTRVRERLLLLNPRWVVGAIKDEPRDFAEAFAMFVGLPIIGAPVLWWVLSLDDPSWILVLVGLAATVAVAPAVMGLVFLSWYLALGALLFVLALLTKSVTTLLISICHVRDRD